MQGCSRRGEESQEKRRGVMRHQRLIPGSMRCVVVLCMPQESHQIVQSMAQDTALPQGGIVGEVESISPLVLGDKFSTELRRFTPRAGIRHKDVGCQRSDKTVSVLG